MLRRHALQIGGLAAAAAIVAALAVVSLHVGGSGSRGATPTQGRVAATATPDPRVAQLKSFARAFIAAQAKARSTGDSSEVDALVVPGSEADGNAGVGASFARSTHITFVTIRIDVQEPSWSVSVLGEHAIVIVSYRYYGHNATFPGLVPTNADRETDVITAKIELARTGDRWVVEGLA